MSKTEKAIELRIASMDNTWTCWLLVWLWLFFFCRGCDGDSSYFDEYMKGAHGHVVEGVEYEATTEEEPP